MRIFVLFALALTGTAIITDDASAGPFRRNRGGAAYSGGSAGPCDCSGGYAGGYAGAGVGYAGTYSAQGADGLYYPTGPNPSTITAGTIGQMSGRAAVIQTTDGQFYSLGADGSYYPASAGAGMTAGYPTMGGFATQPYYGGTYRSGYSPYRGGYSSYYPSGVYPAGYPGYYPGGVYPAGGTPPLTMPVPGVGNIPLPMPRK